MIAIQPDCPFRLQVLWRYPDGGVDLETALHREFKHYRLHHEWFDFGDEDPVAARGRSHLVVVMVVVTFAQRRWRGLWEGREIAVYQA
ncbi:GIY-YIG nuclease family protein [Kibdelosporangium phytohabitans]|uniref:GIY-YIG nuclease family protein n=1 Tax=Kibdelosporangium phytohabitans TaxID=860235 RepID=UPI0009F8B0FE